MAWLPVVIAAAGVAAQAKGASDTKKQNARDTDAQTKLSGAEFDKRNSLANDIFAENATISKDTYTQMANLSDQEFAARTGLSKDAFNQLSRIQQDQVARDYISASTNVDATRDARLGRDATVDAATGARDTDYAATIRARDEREAAARAKYESDVAAANAKQTGFRNQGDTVASNLVAAFTPEAMAKRRTDAVAQRGALVADAMTAPGSNASATAADNVRAAFAKYSKAGTDRAASTAQAGSNLSAYTDAVTAGDRTIDQGGEDIAFIKDAAARALSPLGATLDASSLGFNNAGATAADRITGLNARYGDVRNAAKARYGDRTGAADADLEAALRISGTRAAGETKPVVDYTSAMDDAQAAFFGGRQQSSGTRGDTLIGANNAKLSGSNSASSNFENNSANINQFKMANNSSLWTTLGQFASAIVPTLTNIGQRNAFDKAAKAGTA